MEQQKMLNKIVETLEDITNLATYFAQQNEVPAIERDLVKEKLRWVYDSISSLNSEMLPSMNIHTGGQVVDKKAEINETALEDKRDSEDSNDELTREVEFEVKDRESEQKPVESFKDEKQKSQGEQEQQVKKSEILSDKYKTAKDSVNEYMARHTSGRDVATKLQGKPLKDIHQGIGLNDKFQLISELFKGDKSLYDKTIDRLNHASNFNDAFSFIQDNFTWDMDSPLVQQLLELTRRKFISATNE